MSKLQALQKANTKRDLARLLGVKTSFLTYVLYVLGPSAKYTSFDIKKKSGGCRQIMAPSPQLKSLQSALSLLLQDCIEEINQKKIKTINGNREDELSPKLSHGFCRGHSIITNAMPHVGKRLVLNVDLKDFFGSFNFGRVRGFFIKNRNFCVDQDVATVIAQIACHNNMLPQGSPSSPVITNLITHSLDIRLASLAADNSCTYTRYADDLTFSTRKKEFPPQIMRYEDGAYIPGKDFAREIKRAGLELNKTKTRLLYKDSRQEVTGLVVNAKPNVKNEYWRTVKAQCHKLFKEGVFTKNVDGEHVEGSLNELEGQLNFIDQVDRFNRLRLQSKPDPRYQIRHGNRKDELLTGRERTFGRFLYYRWFYGQKEPTILCEGKTDNVYLKSAISSLASKHPKLARSKTKTQSYKLRVSFFSYSKRTRFLLNLYGGTSYISLFINDFKAKHEFYSSPKPMQPVIIVLDNDSGFDEVKKALAKVGATAYPRSLKKDEYKNASFIHVQKNLYAILTPLSATGDDTAIEDLFAKKTLG